jgi:hypothetical protein
MNQHLAQRFSEYQSGFACVGYDEDTAEATREDQTKSVNVR